MADARAWMPFYVGSYLKNTRSLSPAEHGAYLLLMLEYWNRQGPLPDDDDALRFIAGMSKREWKKAREKLLGLPSGFSVEKGEWRQQRLDEEINKAKSIVERNRENGSKGGRPKTQTKPKPEPSDNPSKNTSTPTSTKESKTPLPSEAAGARREFRILDFLGDDELAEARRMAPRWDIYSLAETYDAGIREGIRDIPKLPRRAFPAWCKAYTKGKPPAGVAA